MRMVERLKKYKNRITSIVMAAVISVLVPFQPLAVHNVKATGNTRLYIKEVKLFISEDSDAVDLAMKWCEDQKKNGNGDWHFVPAEDSNTPRSILQGYLSEWSQSTVCYFCYSTTTDPKEAITDLAVMNETGNYSETAFEHFLDDQKEAYVDLVESLKDMIEEYKKNYENGVQTAIYAHDILNKYIEDDSGKLLGDFLLEATESELVNMFLQANGQVVLLMQNQLASACDTKKSTWLDRLSVMGTTLENPDYEEGGEEPKYLDGYQALYKKYYLAYNKNSRTAIRAMDTKYKERAMELLNSWGDIKQHMDDCDRFAEENGLNDMSEEELESWWKDNEGSESILAYEQEVNALECLLLYPYAGASLYEYFNRSSEEMKDNITELYPLVEALSEGQESGLQSTVSLFSLILSATNASYLNGYKNGMSEIIDNTELPKKEEKEVKKTEEAIIETVEDWSKKDKISVYEGVDREIYKKGGIAITSAAESYSNRSLNKWVDNFVDSNKLYYTMGALAAGAIMAGIGAFRISSMLHSAVEDLIEDVWFDVNTRTYPRYNVSIETRQLVQNTKSFDNFMNGVEYGPAVEKLKYRKALNDMYETGLNAGKNARFKYNLGTYCKMGLTIFAILLAVADITMTIIALVKYYNRSHLPIPHHMIDLVYEENEDQSYAVYKGVVNQYNNITDMYDDKGKQWLVVYYTKDPGAGDPILAPDGNLNKILLKFGKGQEKVPTGYSPLHYFGTPNAAQSLTYEDGEKGWTYNDKSNGCYLFFVRDPNAYINTADSKDSSSDKGVATVLVKGNWIITFIIGVSIGIVLTVVMTVITRRRRRKENTEK